jgi:hypothetical protein
VTRFRGYPSRPAFVKNFPCHSLYFEIMVIEAILGGHTLLGLSDGRSVGHPQDIKLDLRNLIDQRE